MVRSLKVEDCIKMFKKVDLKEEIQRLKRCDVRTYSGRKQQHLIVTIATVDGKENIHYYFRSPNEYSKFISKLRRMC